MKKLFVVLFALGIAAGASAQHIHRGGFYRPVPRFYGSYGFYPGYYSPFYSPFYANPYAYYGYRRPTRLDQEVSDIEADYQDKIYSARHDKSVPKKERKQIIKDLKHERDQKVSETERNYYKS